MHNHMSQLWQLHALHVQNCLLHGILSLSCFLIILSHAQSNCQCPAAVTTVAAACAPRSRQPSSLGVQPCMTLRRTLFSCMPSTHTNDSIAYAFNFQILLIYSTHIIIVMFSNVPRLFTNHSRNDSKSTYHVCIVLRYS